MMMSKERRMEDSERFLRDVGERRRRGGGDVFTIHYPRNNTLLGKSRLLFCRWHTHFSYKLRLKRATARCAKKVGFSGCAKPDRNGSRSEQWETVSEEGNVF